MPRFLRMVTIVLICLGLAFLTLVATGAFARSLAEPVPDDLYRDLGRIALSVEQNPEYVLSTGTYAPEDDAYRLMVRVLDSDDAVRQWTAWGRMTTADGINHLAMNLTSFWKATPVDRAAFLDATGCADVRVISNPNPRADLETNELGWTADFAAERPEDVVAEMVLCLTPHAQIVQVVSLYAVNEPAPELTDATRIVVAWLSAGDAPETGCPPAEDGFSVQAIERDC